MKKILSLLTGAALATCMLHTNLTPTHAVLNDCCDEYVLRLPTVLARQYRFTVYVYPEFKTETPLRARVTVLSARNDKRIKHEVSPLVDINRGCINRHIITYTQIESLPPEVWFRVDVGWQDSTFHIFMYATVEALSFSEGVLGATNFECQIN
jgi:hypothetical protein